MRNTDLIVAAAPVAAALFAGMLACLELGRRLGKRRLARDPGENTAGLGSVDGAVFGIYGLLIAFTFGGAASRFDTRKQLIAQEANTIATAYFRLDLLPADTQPGLRKLFRDYLDTRLEAYRTLPDIEAAKAILSRSETLQREIWDAAVTGTRSGAGHPDAGRLLLPALNDMVGMTTTRVMAMRIHPPFVIFALLFVLALVCSVLAGFSMAVGAHRSWLHIFSFALITVIAVFTILDIEYPRAGLVRINPYDQVLIDLRAEMR